MVLCKMLRCRRDFFTEDGRGPRKRASSRPGVQGPVLAQLHDMRRMHRLFPPPLTPMPRLKRVSTLFATLSLLTLLPLYGCKSDDNEQAQANDENRAQPDVVASEAPAPAPWEGPLAELLPARTPAWIYIDAAALRAHPQAGPLVQELSLGADDTLSRALVEADELAVGWQDAALEERLTILRTSSTHEEISAALERGVMPGSGRALQERQVREFSVWDDPTNGWSIATPAPNLLLTGPATMLSESLVALSEATNEAGPDAGAQIVYGVDIPMEVREEIVDMIGRPMANRQVYALERIYGGVVFADSLDMTMRLSMPTGGSPGVAAAIVRMGAEAMLPDLLGQLFHPLYVERLMANIAVEAQESPRRGVLITASLPQEDTELWSTALLETMRGSDVVGTSGVGADEPGVSAEGESTRSAPAPTTESETPTESGTPTP